MQVRETYELQLRNGYEGFVVIEKKTIFVNGKEFRTEKETLMGDEAYGTAKTYGLTTDNPDKMMSDKTEEREDNAEAFIASINNPYEPFRKKEKATLIARAEWLIKNS